MCTGMLMRCDRMHVFRLERAARVRVSRSGSNVLIYLGFSLSCSGIVVRANGVIANKKERQSGLSPRAICD